MSTPTPPLNPLVTKVRSTHPGAYDDMDDATLTKAVLAKYPQYSDLAAPPMPTRPKLPGLDTDVKSSLGGYVSPTGEGPVARALTSFEAGASNIPSAISHALTHPDSQKLREDVKYNGSLLHDIPAGAANILSTLSPLDTEGIPSNASIPQALKQAASPENVGSTASNILPWIAAKKLAPETEIGTRKPGAPPDPAVGAEHVFRAAAPTGTNVGFRDNLEAVKGDLAEIGRKTDLSPHAGTGKIANSLPDWVTDKVPDTRVRAGVKAINDHLADMYATERAPQIERNASAQLTTDFGPDAANGVQDLTKHAGLVADKALANRVMSNPSASLADLDRLARITNSELQNFESMDPAGKAQAITTRPGIAGLKALDKELSAKIGQELARRGEGGLEQYERRYAGLSSVRDQLQTRMNASELARQKLHINPLDLVRKSPLASASQAALTGESAGGLLQKGFDKLGQSGISADRAVGSGAPPVKGLLGTGATELGPSSATSPLSPPPAIDAATRATRKGLLLPERTSFDMPSSQEPIGTPSAPPDIIPYQPSLQQPPAFVRPGEIRPAAPEPQLLPPGEPLRDPNAAQGDLFQQRVPGEIAKALKFEPGVGDIDRQAEQMAMAERDAGKLPKGTSFVQRAQQIKDELKGGGK